MHTPALLDPPCRASLRRIRGDGTTWPSSSGISTRRSSPTPRTSLQLLEGSKLIYNFSKWGLPSAKYKFPRFVFGGLKANTTYTARIQRISADASKFGDSEWVNIPSLRRRRRIIPTVSSMPISTNIGGGRQRCGHRIRHVSQDGEGRSDGRPDPVGLYVRHAGQEHAQPQQRLRRGAAADYHRLFLSQWDASKLPTATEDYMLRSYLTAGILKFGSTENNGYMPIPYMTSLTGPTTVVLTFKSSPYCEPNTSTGRSGSR